jgi:hypothetical protein
MRCHFGECSYAECHVLFINLQNVGILSVIMHNDYVECRYVDWHYPERHYAEWHYAEWHYAECRHAECHGASTTVIFSNTTFSFCSCVTKKNGAATFLPMTVVPTTFGTPNLLKKAFVLFVSWLLIWQLLVL